MVDHFSMQTNNTQLTLIPLSLTLVIIVLVIVIAVIVIKKQSRIIEKQIESFKNILRAQELERERIARDMHDQVGPLLSKLKLSFDSMDAYPNKQDWEDFKENSKEIINTTMSDIRTTSYDLMPRILYSKELPSAIEDFCEMMSRGLSIQIIFTSENYPTTVSKQSEVNIYRILQEIISNALKYSKAKNMSVSINGQHDKLIIFINDDGVGFDFDKMKNDDTQSFGLKNIESRVSLLDGRMQFKSKSNYVTSYLITFKNSKLQ